MIADTWFQSLPGKWRAERLKIATRLVDRKVTSSASEQSYIGLENVESWTGRLTMTAPVIAESTVNEFSPGDVLFGKLRPYLAKALRVEQCGVCSTEFLVLRPRTVFAQFLLYTLLSKDFIDVVNAWTYGVKMPRANWDVIGNLMIPVPPLDLQSEIVSFLDRETAEADALVAKYERLIGLLEEKRVALITQAVTKGLDPSAPMKDSGVEWMGLVPSHWRVERIKWVAKLESGHTPDKKVASYWDNGTIPWVSLNDTGVLKVNDYISETAYYTTDEGLQNSSAHLLPAGTVVFSRDATIGRCAITKRPMAVSQHFIAWVPGSTVIPEYLLRVLRTMTQELERLTFGATIKTIGMPDVKILRMPVPPISEQEAICSAILHSSREIERTLENVRRAISLIREHRSALITAAVTGQIDVTAYRSKTKPLEISA